MSARAVQAWVSGLVQGVGFRFHTRQKARELGLTGWVRNLPDGRVEVWIEGEQAATERLLAWLRSGPVGAQVSALEVVQAQPRGLSAFELERA